MGFDAGTVEFGSAKPAVVSSHYYRNMKIYKQILFFTSVQYSVKNITNSYKDLIHDLKEKQMKITRCCIASI